MAFQFAVLDDDEHWFAMRALAAEEDHCALSCVAPDCPARLVDLARGAQQRLMSLFLSLHGERCLCLLAFFFQMRANGGRSSIVVHPPRLLQLATQVNPPKDAADEFGSLEREGEREGAEGVTAAFRCFSCVFFFEKKKS